MEEIQVIYEKFSGKILQSYFVSRQQYFKDLIIKF